MTYAFLILALFVKGKPSVLPKPGVLSNALFAFGTLSAIAYAR